MAGATRRRGLEVARPDRPLADALGEPVAEDLEPFVERLVTLVAPKCLEPPLPVAVEAKEVVVEGEREVRERHAPRRWRRNPLEASAQVVPQVAEPAATDRLARC